MKTLTKTIAAMAGLLLLAGCGAVAQDQTPKAAGPGYGPGWRHEQMVQAWEKGEVPPGPMMMMRNKGPGPAFAPGPGSGPGMRGFGPPVDENGKIDTSKLPDWCPMKQAAPQ